MNIAFGDVLLGLHDRPFLYVKNMEKNKNVEMTTIYANKENYFEALAKILILFKKDYQEKTFIFDKDKILTEVIRDLKALQKYCVIKNKNGKIRKHN